MNNKIFIIGLPRTGTTSICAKFLELGFNVAHTAYTSDTFKKSQVIADTPVFADFAQLDLLYPDSKFIYLNRINLFWLPSIKQLLNRMYKNVIRTDGGFNPIIKRCYMQIFDPFTLDNINNDQFLIACYLKHQKKVTSYFKEKSQQFLTLDISDIDAPVKLQSFLNITQPISKFERLNTGGKITAWKDINSPFKISSTKNGHAQRLPYII